MAMWWHDDMSPYAQQLSNGVLNEMKRRILTSNIQKEKLQLDESTNRMKQFFEREIKRYSNRKEKMKQKEADVETYRRILRELVQCNISLAKKCKKYDVKIEQVKIHGDACSWH